VRRRKKAEGRSQPSAYCFLPSAFCFLPSAFCFLPSAFCFLPSAFAFRYLPSAFPLHPVHRYISHDADPIITIVD
jgi:hypothetical protein